MSFRKHLIKLLAVTLFLPLASCNKNVSWDLSKEKLDKSITLDGYFLSTDYDCTVLEISNNNGTFVKEKIDKSHVIVKASKKDAKEVPFTGNDDDPYIHSLDQLFANRIDPMSVTISDNFKKLYVYVDKNYADCVFEVIVHPDAMSSNEYGCATSIQKNDIDFDDPYLEPLPCIHIAGETYPEFIFYHYNLGDINPELITTSGAFSDLKIYDYAIDDDFIYIKFLGQIKNEEYGYINFNPGFSERINQDISFEYDVVEKNVFLDPTTIQFNDGDKTLTANLNFTEPLLSSDASTINIELNKKQFSVISKEKKDAYTLSVKLQCPNLSEEEIVNEFKGLNVQIADKGETYVIEIIYNEPKINSAVHVENNKIKMYLNVTDGIFYNDESVVVTKDNFIINSDIFSSIDLNKPDNYEFNELTNSHVLTFDIPESETVRNLAGTIKLKNVPYVSSYGEIFGAKKGEEDTYYEIPFEYHAEEAAKYSGQGLINNHGFVPERLKYPVNETVYEAIMKDKLSWQTIAHAGIQLIGLGGTIGAAAAGCSEAAGELPGMILGLIDSIIGMTEGDPIEAIIQTLYSIDSKLNDLSKEVAELRKELDKLSEQTYMGFSISHYKMAELGWSNFYRRVSNQKNKSILSFKGAILDYLYNFLKQDGNTLEVSYSSTKTEGFETDFLFEIMGYENTSTAGKTITTKFNVTLDTKSIFTKSISQLHSIGRMNSKIVQLMYDDLLTYLKNNLSQYTGGDRIGCITFFSTKGNTLSDFYNTYIKDKEESKQIEAARTLAFNIINTLFANALKSVFKNDDASKDKAREFVTETIAIIKEFAGLDALYNQPAYAYFYDMMKSRFGFQSEAINHIKTFRMAMKRTLHSFTSMSKSVLELYPNKLGLYDDLKSAYDEYDNKFALDKKRNPDNFGIYDTDNVMVKNGQIYSCDFCYVTNSYVTTTLFSNRTQLSYSMPGKPCDASIGSSSNSYLLLKNNNEDKTVEVDARLLNFVPSDKLKFAFERRKLHASGSLDNISYLKKIGALSDKVFQKHNEKAPGSTAIITSYKGITTPYFPNYKTSVNVTCKAKLPSNAKYFTLNKVYNIQSISRDPKKKYGRIFKTTADVYDFNNLANRIRDNLGHVYWYEEDHWYWSASHDEVWGFNEFNDITYYYTMLQVSEKPIISIK